jgi:hypothetical protein
MNSQKRIALFENLNLNDIWKNGSETERSALETLMNEINVKRRNDDKTENFTKKIIKKQNPKKSHYLKFIESKSINGMIWAPTQVGKSAATSELIRTCFQQNVPVIVSTDNKNDQCDQLYTRVYNSLIGANVQMLRVSDKNFTDDFEKCIKSKNYRFAVFCLNNSKQISKIIQAMKVGAFNGGMSHIKKLAVVHDEADTITKDKEIEIKNDKQAESHKKWIEFVDMFNTQIGGIDLKRIFITATPENVCMLYNIDNFDVMTLEIPSSYVGYKDLKYSAIDDDLDVKEIIANEVDRIKTQGTYEIILYCVERTIVLGHMNILHSIATEIKCSANTYNGKGISVVFDTKEKSSTFVRILQMEGIKHKVLKDLIEIKEIPIRTFYRLCKKAGENCMITIGKDLISRGISYVSEDTVDPLTATTIIYKPGISLHAVGITQTIGRITGCAMPSLERRVYAPQDVIDTYKKYCANQELYIAEITKSDSPELTKNIIENMKFDKIKRDIDRKNLGLRMNFIEEDSDTAYESDYYDEDKMKRLVKSWIRETNKTQIATLFRDTVANGGCIEGIDETNCPTTRRHASGWDLIFERHNDKLIIRKEAMNYYESLLS